MNANSRTPPRDGRQRVVIEAVRPQVDGGRFPVKRVVGDQVEVTAKIFADGHDALRAALKFRRKEETTWDEVPMSFLGNDNWRASFTVEHLGSYEYSIDAWADEFVTWQRDLKKRVDAGQDVSVELLVGARIVREAEPNVSAVHSDWIRGMSDALSHDGDLDERIRVALSDELADLMSRYAEHRYAVCVDPPLEVAADRRKAAFSTWYELFPRSSSHEPGRHGTLRDCAQRLDYVADLGFDVLYLPPIHPIGRQFRKGKNNAVTATDDDVGSPWAIGAAEGGHKSIHPSLGTMDDFQFLIAEAGRRGIEIAMDIAFQCAPDHPYVSEHPEWFRKRPDGTIQYAENPPKKYQDIYPFDFECADWRGLWEELRDVVLFWAGQGVRIFRVDNPHTKAFGFWEWLIGEVRQRFPESIFLAEAFTRPAVMHRLAKLGFTQSYTYFTWRNTKTEITEYFRELTQTDVREFMRPNLWPNTPDILNEYLQFGGRPAFMARYVLAATLGANCGIYGPAFELTETRPREPGSEEYLDSEKYQIRIWDWNSRDSLAAFVARVNRIRRENIALHGDWSLEFHPVDNEQLICFSKKTSDDSNIVVVVVNLDPHHTQSGWVELPLREMGIDGTQPYQAHDLFGDGRYLWVGARNYVELNPHVLPAHIFCLRRRVRTESQFEYYL